MSDNYLRVGQVAERAKVNAQTLRYYERRRLLPAAPRTRSGYRMFNPETVHLVRFIKRAQELGFTLEETGGLLRLRQSPPRSRRRAREMAMAKLQDVEARIGRLQAVRGAP